MNNRITELFARKKNNILSIFFTAGYPNFDDTVSTLVALEKEGVDLVEVGFPFSDPVADGPAIQKSSERALANGMTLPKVIAQIKEARSSVTLPIVLMGYLNPVLQMGYQPFITACADAGIDGLILPDLPLQEFERELREPCRGHGISFIPLVTQSSSDERIRRLDEQASGFLYLVSKPATTGAAAEFSENDTRYFARVKNLGVKNPCLVGFGIHDHATFQVACTHVDGAIIGSAFIRGLDAGLSIREALASVRL